MNFPESKWLKVVNAGSDTQPAEILIIGRIGTSYWDDNSVGERDFRAALAAVPVGRKITIGINSEGGNVKDGLGIYHAIQARKQDVTCRIDGCAWSIASVIAIAGAKTISPRVSVWMIHDPWTYCEGNADEMRKAADCLDTNAKVLVAAYAEKTGKTESEIRAAMKKETWMTGDEALSWGLSDEVSDTPVQVSSGHSGKTSSARIPSHVLNLIRNPQKPIASVHQEEQQKESTMKLLLAALAGAKLIPTADNITDEQASTTVVAALAKRDSDLQAAQASLATERTAKETAEASLAETRKALAELAVETDVKAGRLKDDATLRAKWVESYANDYEGTKTLMAGLAEQRPAATSRGVPLSAVAAAGATVDEAEVVKAYKDETDPNKRAALWSKHRDIIVAAARKN